MSRNILSIVAFAASLIAGANAGVDREKLEQMIIWQDDASDHRALFIPESVLESTRVEDLPISESSYKTFPVPRNHPAKNQRELQSVPGSWCRETSLDAPNYARASAPRSDAVDVLGRVASDYAILGHVVAATKGWHEQLAVPVRMSYVLVDEILHSRLGREASVHVGDVLATVSFGGYVDIYVEDVLICRGIGPEFYVPEPGDQVLLIGGAATQQVESGVVYFEWPLTFQVISGEVQPQPYPQILDRDPVPLDRIRSFLAALESEE